MKIIGKINLEEADRGRKERIDFEKISLFLRRSLSSISSEINDKYKFFGQILENDVTIKITGEDSDIHKLAVESKEKAWARERNEPLEVWKEKKEINPATISEFLITILLHNTLKDRFLVTRASNYDDYENGIDYVLIDKETGVVICGFDQVLGIGKDDGSFQKTDKLERKLLNGGAKLEHGITFDNNGNLIRKKLKNLPIFSLAISKEDLDKILIFLQKNINLSNNNIDELKKDKDFNAFNNEIFKKMIDSLNQQFVFINKLKELNADGRYNKLLENIDKFKDSFAIIKEKFGFSN